MSKITFDWIEENIKGALHSGEGEFLYELASKCRDTGVIVEIGSLLGKSTTYLALGSKNGSHIAVYAIDTFDGGQSANGYNIRSQWIKDLIRNGSYLTIFMNNLKKADVLDIVYTLPFYSSKAVHLINQPIELLFIDGSHAFRHVKTDFELFYPKVQSNGLIALHDRDIEGVSSLINQIVKNKKDLVFCRNFRSISLWRKE